MSDYSVRTLGGHYEPIDWTKIDAFIVPSALWSSASSVGGHSPSDVFEFEAKRNPFSVKLWITYLNSSKSLLQEERFILYERALNVLPRSYKLWHLYLQERVTAILGELPTSPLYEEVNNLFERCLIYLSLMPRIWLMYFDFLALQPCITRTRRCHDRALQTLPVTQHKAVWESYCSFIDRIDVPLTSITVYRRYLMYDSSKVVKYIELLKKVNRIDQAAVVLADTLCKDIISVEGKTAYQLWIELCELISAHAQAIKSLNVEAVLRSGIRKFAEQVARLWCNLASYYVQLGQMEKARDIYEEALESITTANDFGIIYEAYTQFMESVLSNIMRLDSPDHIQVDLYVERLENLIQRRPILLSSVKLRQNPHNVLQWLQRVKLFLPDDPVMAVKTFTEAVITVDPYKAIGKYPLLWTEFAEFYEAHKDSDNVTQVFDRAVKAKYRSVEDLANIWCAWVEFELRQGHGRRALEIARQALHKPIGKPSEEKGYHQYYVYKCMQLWSLCADLEEAFGTLATHEACYDKMFELKVITPSHILNYAAYLVENKYWEKAFRIYERGVAILRWPHVYDVWITYLAMFVSRYEGKKLERAREIFEQVLEDAPKHLSKYIYLMYGQLEETYGLARHAISIYDRASRELSFIQDVSDMYMLLAAKTSEYFGITRTRPIFERALGKMESLDNSVPYLLKFGLRFITIERSLGEIDRARSIFQHLSQFCDPTKEIDFWQSWRQFEIAHGNEELFREMLRTKRAVQALYAEDAAKNPEAMLAMAQQKLQAGSTEECAMEQLENALTEASEVPLTPELAK